MNSKTSILNSSISNSVSELPNNLPEENSVITETNLWSPKSKATAEPTDNANVNGSQEVLSETNEVTLTNTSMSKLESSDISLEAAESHANANDQRIMRGIMMSSHNVSSMHEIENRFINARRSREQDTHSVCLSHASRDQMVAGPRELFNANDKKLAIEYKQKQLQ